MDENPTYYLWNPVLQKDKEDRTVVILNMTPGEYGRLPEESLEIPQKILKDLGLDARPQSWKVLGYRSSYQGEGEEAEEWQDRWPVNWRVEILLDRPIAHLPVLVRESIGTIAFDPAVLPQDHDGEGEKVAAMVIADFQRENHVNKARAKINQLAIDRDAPVPQYYRVRIGNLFVQEQINLGEYDPAFFEDGAEYMQTVERICESAKGITNFEERTYEWDELYNPEGRE